MDILIDAFSNELVSENYCNYVKVFESLESRKSLPHLLGFKITGGEEVWEVVGVFVREGLVEVKEVLAYMEGSLQVRNIYLRGGRGTF